MKIHAQSYIEDCLITVDKRILRSERKRMWRENRHFRNNFELISMDDTLRFRVFLRYSEEFVEDFSIGLIWLNAIKVLSVPKSVVLLRCQGPHDGSSPLGSDLHHSYHTHEITENDLVEQRYTKPSNKGVNREFSSFQTAALYFVRRCRIVNAFEYHDFAISNQLSLVDVGVSFND